MVISLYPFQLVGVSESSINVLNLMLEKNERIGHRTVKRFNGTIYTYF